MTSYMGYPMYGWDYHHYHHPHHVPQTWYPWTGYPWHEHGQGSGYGSGYGYGYGSGYGYGWPGYQGLAGQDEHPYARLLLPQEVIVDSTGTAKSEVFAGGIAPCRLSLEYLPRGGAPSVDVKITGSAGSTTWSDAGFTGEYNVKSDFWPVQPGDRISIAVADAVARLRWCEIVEP